MDKKVSIIIPVFNKENYISMLLDSVCSQSYENIEIICVNDGSTDESDRIVKKFAGKDSRIKCFDIKQNKGAWYARNLGLKHAQGDYVRFVDADDIIPKESTEVLLKYMDDDINMVRGRLFCESKWVCITEKNFIHGHIFNPKRENDFCRALLPLTLHCSALFNKEYLIKNNIFYDESCDEDSLFLIKNYFNLDSAVMVDEVVYTYISRKNSAMTKRKSYKWYEDYLIKTHRYMYECSKKNNNLQIADMFLLRRYLNQYPEMVLNSIAADIHVKDLEYIVNEHSSILNDFGFYTRLNNFTILKEIWDILPEKMKEFLMIIHRYPSEGGNFLIKYASLH